MNTPGEMKGFRVFLKLIQLELDLIVVCTELKCTAFFITVDTCDLNGTFFGPLAKSMNGKLCFVEF